MFDFSSLLSLHLFEVESFRNDIKHQRMEIGFQLSYFGNSHKDDNTGFGENLVFP